MNDAPDDEVLGLQIATKFLEETMEDFEGVWREKFPYNGQDIKEVEATASMTIQSDFGMKYFDIKVKKMGNKLDVTVEYEYEDDL